MSVPDSYIQVARKLDNTLNENEAEAIGRLLMMGHGMLWEVSESGISPYPKAKMAHNVKNCQELWQLVVHGRPKTRRPKGKYR